MKIPKKIKIVGTDWKVELNNNYCKKEKCLGQMYPNEGKIYYCDKYKNKKISKSKIEETFLHEWVHAMFNTNGIEDDNEQFVNILATNILQLFNQLKK